MRWAGLVECLEDMRNLYRILVGELEGGGHFKDLGLGGRIILEWFLVL
jgi:hypothetical protein